MFHDRQSEAHLLAMISSSTALVGLTFHDVQWAISVFASLFGTCAALWMFNQRNRDTKKG